MWFIVFGVFEEYFVHIGTGILIQFIAAAEYNQRDFTIAQHRQLVRLFHYAKFTFVEGHLHRKKRFFRKKKKLINSNEFCGWVWVKLYDVIVVIA